MEQSPSSESNSHSTKQETSRLLCNPKVHDETSPKLSNLFP